MCVYRRRIVRCAHCEEKVIDDQRVLLERCNDAWTSGTERIHPICLNWRYDENVEDEDVISDDEVCTPCFDKLKEEAAKERERRGEPPIEEEEEPEGNGSGSSGKEYDSDGYSI
ncbi:unnamed protein product [Tilletia controversa]|uniref:Uncharacterized protein n=3 Tax=Tilletia TaxID=13289 RepID=A0A8X7MUB9_9BASI|nr:hypothetical protein CF336_g3671 [Tilletia laevis]KAE8205391.1 hypothetical protein CF328_g524 [Tilletia controversa]CAD6885813.1 unnamed protein product [Tilletia caries]KAE8208718.1 hypothetical protein CF335_g206 [Tilletia laevis]KAE8248068.1 hypothetical protein A4X06_0g3982 [Tilletia controversa]